jgi:N-acetylneuraminate synthase
MRKIAIGNKKIGSGEPCFIIAEAGVNHNGSLDCAKQLIDAACKSGADAVKFQTFSADRIASRTARKADYQLRTTDVEESQYTMLKKLELPPEDFHVLAEYTKKKGVVFLSSPFDCESVDILEKAGVDAYKIPSGEITNVPLLRHIAGKRKPVILSTGMAEMEEIAEAVKLFRNLGIRDLILLHCVTSYPAASDTLNLQVIKTLRRTFGIPVGFSDHSQGIFAAVISRVLGACVIEKHFTLDRNMPGPDHQASLEPDELAALVAAVRATDSALGDGKKHILPAEQAIKCIARKSLVAREDIPAGATVTQKMFEVKRPGTGISPRDIELVVGRTAKRQIPRDTVLTWMDLA